MRGEYAAELLKLSTQKELPPRARRIHVISVWSILQIGTTSACAENTGRLSKMLILSWNYLRVRGEYPIVGNRKKFIVELPPRARRIPRRSHWAFDHTGTTSACAENTHITLKENPICRNYLRVRGEYSRIKTSYSSTPELPPRARRIRCPAVVRALWVGTTSACAENTPSSIAAISPPRNYLRVRGEYTAKRWIVSAPAELPPRARRIR